MQKRTLGQNLEVSAIGLEENIAAAAVDLTAGDLAEIEDAQITAEGARYSETGQRMIDR